MLPQNVLNNLVDYVRVSFAKDGTLNWINYPKDRELNLALSICGGKGIHISTDQIAAEIITESNRLMPEWRQQFMNLHANPPKVKPEFLVAPKAVTEEHVPEIVGIEARIKMMNTTQMEELCERNNIQYNKEAPNRGVLCMRMRNLAYAALKQGKELV